MGNKTTTESKDLNYSSTRNEIIISIGDKSIKEDQKTEEPGYFAAFGDNDYGIVTYLSKLHIFDKLFFGNFQCFVYSKKDNKYYSFGYNNYGQLGQGNSTNYLRKNTSEQYNFFETFGSMWDLTYLNNKHIKTKVKFTLMSFGDGFTIAADNLNNLYSWGRGEESQLGFELAYNDSDIVQGVKCKLKPTHFFTAKSEIAELQSGKDFTFMITADKEIFAWGNNNQQQIMPYKYQDEYEHHRVYTYKKATSIDYKVEFSSIKCGWSHSVGVSFEGKGYVWGKIEEQPEYEEFYQLKVGNVKFKEVHSGFSHILLKGDDGHIYSFGDNKYVGKII